MEPFNFNPMKKKEFQTRECLFNPYILYQYQPIAPYKKMSTFSQILHKQTADSNELYSFNMENSKENMFEFYRLAFSKEFNTTNILATTVKMYMFHLSSTNPTNNIKKKFAMLRDIFKNDFLNAETKAVLLDNFSKAQCVYRRLCRLAYRYKWNKASIKIQCDLCMEPISPTYRNVITILHSDQKYLFTISDLLKIIESSLSNSPYFFAEPLSIKNPYTNLPFPKSHLYNIYFFMKERVVNVSPIFHAYFMCNFHLRAFRDENGPLIQKYNIKQHVKNADLDSLHEDAVTMLTVIKYRGAIQVDDSFPRERLVEIMRPYLELYYTYTLTVDVSERNKTRTELSNRLSAFYKYNHSFGRKFIKTQKTECGKRIRNITYNDGHIPYAKMPRFTNYETSHLRIMEGANSYSIHQRYATAIASLDDSDGDSESEDDSPAPIIPEQARDFIWFVTTVNSQTGEQRISQSVETESSGDENDENVPIINIPPLTNIHPDDLEDGEILEESDDDFEDESDDGNYDP